MEASLRRPGKSVDDLLALPEGTRAELLDGEVYVSPAASPLHQSVAGALWRALDDHATEFAGGVAYAACVDVHLPTGDVVQPDVLWVRAERLEIVTDAVHGAPDLVVEVVSPSHPERDRIVKRALYARSLVREYWIADLEARGIEVLELAEDRYRPAGWFTAGTTLRSPLLSRLTIDVSRAFADPRSRVPPSRR